MVPIFRTAEYRETIIVCQDNIVYIVALKNKGKSMGKQEKDDA